MDNIKWLPEEETYLKELSRLSEELSKKFKRYHDLYKERQAKFKIPAIVISSITGIISFGTSNFPPQYSNFVSIGVGISSLFIALINSIESYMKIGETMSGSIQASMSFQKLKESIDVELALPPEDRTSQGIIFLRECFSQYEKIWDLAPNILKNVRFIRPSYQPNASVNITLKQDQTSSDIEQTEITLSETLEDELSSPRAKKAKTMFFV
jgi:hypothetical protein